MSKRKLDTKAAVPFDQDPPIIIKPGGSMELECKAEMKSLGMGGGKHHYQNEPEVGGELKGVKVFFSGTGTPPKLVEPPPGKSITKIYVLYKK